MGLSIQVGQRLFSKRDRFREVSIFRSRRFKEFITLSNRVMFSSGSRFVCSRVIARIPVAMRPGMGGILVVNNNSNKITERLVRCPRVRDVSIIRSSGVFISMYTRVFPSVTRKLGSREIGVCCRSNLQFLQGGGTECSLVVGSSASPLKRARKLFAGRFCKDYCGTLESSKVVICRRKDPFCSRSRIRYEGVREGIFQSFPIDEICRTRVPAYPSKC